MTSERSDRLHLTDRPEDQRSAFSRDRDRILYCSAFRRLAEVTQVVSADEGHVFHNRLTHTLKVAQIARRLAEMLGDKESTIADALGGIHPEVAEAAALAHDLGHPPFGHVIEKELNALANKNEETDGFEGNAQSFRIITKLAVRHPEQVDGLNLTRATLNATLKYPWYRATSGSHKTKWGVYHSEKADFEFARAKHQFGTDTRCPEAEIMDWADDIAYSVHDVEDFYRAGLIPLDRILVDPEELERFLNASIKRRVETDDVAQAKADGDAQAFRELVSILPPRRLDGRFRGTTTQRAALRSITSFLVKRYVIDVHLRVPTATGQATLAVEPQFESEVAMLKQLVWHYVIENPSLATQQHGQRRAIQELFRIFLEATNGDWGIFSIPHRELLEAAEKDGKLEKGRVRIIVDMISSMTERQAIRLYQRLSGVSLGSVLDQLG